jgi:hypothetical protein
MSLEDYSLMPEVIAAIREGLPDADQVQPGQVFQHVLGALKSLLPAPSSKWTRAGDGCRRAGSVVIGVLAGI